jgi:small subunit ribosomal protein S1
MKDLMPSAWETFVATHRPGDVVRGKVTRFTSFGVFVELGEGLEGLCHISELADQRVEKPEDVAQIGQEMDFKILRIEHEDQKIGLSHRAVGKDEGPVVDTKMYTSEAKGGMASLAELANINLGNSRPAADRGGKKKKERRGGSRPAVESPAKIEPAVETPPPSSTASESPEAAASPAAGLTETPPTEPATEHAPVVESDTLPEEVAPESGDSTASAASTEAESESAAAETSTAIETSPAESASQPMTETEEAAEESEKKSA